MKQYDVENIIFLQYLVTSATESSITVRTTRHVSIHIRTLTRFYGNQKAQVVTVLINMSPQLGPVDTKTKLVSYKTPKTSPVAHRDGADGQVRGC